MNTVEKTIRAEFPGKTNEGLRAELRRLAAETGSVLGAASTIALTASGKAGLESVEAAIRAAR